MCYKQRAKAMIGGTRHNTLRGAEVVKNASIDMACNYGERAQPYDGDLQKVLRHEHYRSHGFDQGQDDG